MKLLFITITTSELSGGRMVSNRNFDALSAIVGENNVLKYVVKRKQETTLWWKIQNLFKEIENLNFHGLNQRQQRDILDIIRNDKIDIVFIDTSTFGFFQKKISKLFPSVRVVTYFHNVESQLAKDALRVNNNIFLGHRIALSYFSEKLVCKYSDKIIAINSRDAEVLENIYKRKCDFIIPITLKDVYTKKNLVKEKLDTKICIFVGSYFFPNIEAIKWILDNILPYINVRLLLVGSNLDKLEILVKNTKNVEIHSNVDDIGYFYNKAHFALFPVLSGSGMKVKTAEALMYGKYVIGTEETFVGYEYDTKVGFCGKTSQDIVKHINENIENFQTFNKPSRDLFDKNYSENASNTHFKKLLDSITF